MCTGEKNGIGDKNVFCRSQDKMNNRLFLTCGFQLTDRQLGKGERRLIQYSAVASLAAVVAGSPAEGVAGSPAAAGLGWWWNRRWQQEWWGGGIVCGNRGGGGI